MTSSLTPIAMQYSFKKVDDRQKTSAKLYVDDLFPIRSKNRVTPSFDDEINRKNGPE